MISGQSPTARGCAYIAAHDPAPAIAPLEKTPLEVYVAPEKPSLVGASRAELAEMLGASACRNASARCARSRSGTGSMCAARRISAPMSSIGKDDARRNSKSISRSTRPEVVTEQVSSDGTRKWLLKLASEHAGERPHLIECVYIPENDRGTLCVSSQVGCTLTCSFCHTGTQRLVRNLTPGEIVGQIMVARDRLGDFLGTERVRGEGLPTEGERCISNIVMMGMGEPLYNFENGARRAACYI